jgi:hypothetical protein
MLPVDGLLNHQNSLFSATFAVVPILFVLAAQATSPARILLLLGTFVDPLRAEPPESDQVRTLVFGHVDEIAGYLGHVDPATRAAAAYLYAQAEGPPGMLWDRWAIEADQAVRASLLFGLDLRDPARSAPTVQQAIVHGSLPERLAAALVLSRAQGTWPDGAVLAVAEAIRAGADIGPGWRFHPPAFELINFNRASNSAGLVGHVGEPGPANVRPRP